MSSNSLFVLKPYKLQGTWVFDDSAVDLHQEPFVLGIDEMLDRLTSPIPDAASGFRLIFSPNPFPGFAAKLELVREEYGGHWYYFRRTRWRGGCARRCSSTSTRRRVNFTSGQNPSEAEAKRQRTRSTSIASLSAIDPFFTRSSQFM